MNPSIVNELKNRLAELKSETEHIESLLKIWDKTYDHGTPEVSTKETKMVRTKIPPKGDQNWLDYIIYAMDFLKSKGQSEVRAQTISDLIKESNTELDPVLVLRAVRNNLLRLIDKERVTKIVAESKIEGYTYKVNEEYAK